MVEQSKWEAITSQDPTHSARYIERFRLMAEAGKDLGGEARFVDAVAPPEARILDAGCGPGRIGSMLTKLGHRVVGVDIDPVLIAEAGRADPGSTWLVADLAELDLRTRGIAEPFDVILCAGNVMTFLATSTRGEVVSRLGAHLADEGRLVVGFGAERDYDFDEFRVHTAEAGLNTDLELGTWDLRPFTDESDFLITVLSRGIGRR